MDRDHYWWLALSWDNLVFSCIRCNDQGHKGNRFPLAGPPWALPKPPYRAAEVENIDLRPEQPLLIDPTAPGADPLGSLAWVPVRNGSSPEQPSWTVRWFDARGRETAKILKLEELAEEVGEHLRKNVWPRVRCARDLAGAGEVARAQQEWEVLLRDQLEDPVASLRGATFGALRDFFTSASERAACRKFDGGVFRRFANRPRGGDIPPRSVASLSEPEAPHASGARHGDSLTSAALVRAGHPRFRDAAIG